MKKNRTLVPDYYFNKFSDVTAGFLLAIGVKGIILDIDNTLEPYEKSEPGIAVLDWFASLNASGIKAAFVSNNNSIRVERFNKNLGFPAYYKSAKPFKKNVLKAVADMKISVNDAILMGDQIFTDVWAARNAGIRAILVPPINDKRDILTRFKRLLEKPVLKKYKARKKL